MLWNALFDKAKENIEIDGQVYTGVVGVQKILELIEKFQNGDLVIEGN